MTQWLDVHTHVGIDAGFMLRGWWPYACTARQLLDDMDRSNIHRAVCFPFTLPTAFDATAFADEKRVALLPGRFPFDRENPCLLDEIARVDSERRLIPFAMFDPAREVDQQVASLKKLIGRIAGLKAQTTILRSSVRVLLNESRALMELATEHNLPVLFHTSVISTDQWAQAADCLDVVEAFPAVRFNLAHSLRFDEPSLKRASQLPNVWIDCSAHLIHCQLARENKPVVAPSPRRVKTDYSNPVAVLSDVEAIIPGKYLWGSDNPYMSWCDDRLCSIFSYAQEAAVLHAAPESLRQRMAFEAPRNWLFGERAK